MKQLKVALALAALSTATFACSTQASAPEEGSEPIAQAEVRDEPGGPPSSRCSGVWDCTKTVVTDFIYLPVRVARGISGDVRSTVGKEDAPAE
jgi:hypothetical protein